MSLATAPHRLLGDKYRLIQPLDKGGMGSVWLAEHLALASPVAIKLITANVAKTAERLQRFLREARAAAAARSPHVVQVLDYGVHDGTPYLVMELLEGESLAERLQRRGQLGANETETIIRHVSRGITRAHEAGIVHRDLKPANIFITRNEEEEIVKVFDFGIAKAAESLGAGGGMGKATRTGSLLGTPYYMSPEQLEGGRRSDHRCDIWALGVIAFECLLGRLPFNGRGIGGLVLAVCSHPPPVPSQLGAVPAGFDDWFARACCRDLDQRFASAREAALSLRAVLGTNVEAEPEPGIGLEPSARESPPMAPETVASADSVAELAAARRASRGTVIGTPPITRPALGRAVMDGPVPGSPIATQPGSSSSSIDALEPGGVGGDVPAFLPATPDPSSATLDQHDKARPRALLLVPIVACAVIALALHGFRRSALAPDGEPREPSAEAAVQPPAQAPATAGLIVLGEGTGLHASVDGQDIGPVPCEVQGVTAGDHTVVISGSARYRPSHHRVHLEPGAVERVGPVKLEVAKGLATVVAGEGTDGAELSLSIDDALLRLPALPVQLEVETAQLHVLHAERRGFEPYHQRLSFEDGDAEKTFAVSLTPLRKDGPAQAEPTIKRSAKAKARRTSSRRSRPRSTPPARAPARTEPSRAEETRAEAPAVVARTTFTFTATPQASVLLDGAPLGTTPLHDVPVAAGSHRVIFIRGAQRKAMLVVGISGQSKLVNASFQSQRD